METWTECVGYYVPFSWWIPTVPTKPWQTVKLIVKLKPKPKRQGVDFVFNNNNPSLKFCMKARYFHLIIVRSATGALALVTDSKGKVLRPPEK